MQDHMTNRKFSFPIFAGFIVILGAIFALIYHYSVYTRSVDFHGHMHFIRRIQEDGLGSVPHFLYHIIILGVAEIFPTDWYRIAEYLMVFVSVITGITIYLLLTKWFKHYLSQVMIGFLTICILTITPIIFWTDYWPALLGYIHPTVYHNPTQTILKMFVIPISLIALRGFNPKPYKNQQERIGLIILSIVLIVLMSLSKPNYTIILLPALGLYCLYRLVNKQELDWGLLIFGIGLPAVIVLALQFLGTYTTEDSTIQLGFLTVLKFYIPPPRIIIQFLLSIAFPAMVYLLHYKTAHQNTYLNFSWISFLIGAFYLYFLYETGIRQEHGNFFWSAYIGLYLLMFATIVFLIKEYRPFIEEVSRNKNTQLPPKLRWILFFFVLHMASAIRYYMMYITQP